MSLSERLAQKLFAKEIIARCPVSYCINLENVYFDTAFEVRDCRTESGQHTLLLGSHVSMVDSLCNAGLSRSYLRCTLTAPNGSRHGACCGLAPESRKGGPDQPDLVEHLDAGEEP